MEKNISTLQDLRRSVSEQMQGWDFNCYRLTEDALVDAITTDLHLHLQSRNWVWETALPEWVDVESYGVHYEK